MVDNKITTLMLDGQTNDKRTNLIFGSGSVDMWFELTSWPGIDVELVYFGA